MSFNDFENKLNESEDKIYRPSMKYSYNSRRIDPSDAVINAILESVTKLTRSQRSVLVQLRETHVPIWNWDSIDEGFWDNVKDVAKNAGDKAAGVVAGAIGVKKDDVVNFVKSMTDPIKNLIKMIKEFVDNLRKQIWEKGAELWEKLMGKDKDKVKEAIQHVIDKEKEGMHTLKNEVIGLKDLGSGIVSYLKDKFTSDAESALGNVDKEDVPEDELELEEESTHESLMSSVEKSCYFALAETIRIEGNMFLYRTNESGKSFHIPFVDKFMAVLVKYKPFSWLHDLETAIAGKTNELLDKASDFFSKNGIVKTATKFKHLGTIVGNLGEMQIENMVEHGIVHTIGIIVPGLSVLVLTLSTITFAMWCVNMFKSIIDAVGLSKFFNELHYPEDAEPAH